MRIGFDAKRAVQNFTGLGNYSRYVIEALCHFYPENEYILYAPRYKSSRQFDHLVNQYPKLSCHYAQVGKPFQAVWRTFGIPRELEREQVDIYHGLSNELPLNISHQRRAKTVLTIHDLIFLRYPRYYSFIDRQLYTYKYRRSCENANAIVAVSEQTQKDLVEFFQVDPAKIHVIYQGCDPQFTVPISEGRKKEVRGIYGLPRRYVLMVGSIEERKNAALIVKAMPYLPEDVHLVLVGKRTPYVNEIERILETNRSRPRVHLLHHVAFSHLPSIYQMAEVFVYPSRFEGFGIPILEALHSFTPVVAATGSCLEEAGGPDSLYVNPDDVKGLSAILNSLLSDSARRQDMARKGKIYAERFSPESQAKKLVSLYQSLL